MNSTTLKHSRAAVPPALRPLTPLGSLALFFGFLERHPRLA